MFAEIEKMTEADILNELIVPGKIILPGSPN